MLSTGRRTAVRQRPPLTGDEVREETRTFIPIGPGRGAAERTARCHAMAAQSSRNPSRQAPASQKTVTTENSVEGRSCAALVLTGGSAAFKAGAKTAGMGDSGSAAGN